VKPEGLDESSFGEHEGTEANGGSGSGEDIGALGSDGASGEHDGSAEQDGTGADGASGGHADPTEPEGSAVDEASESGSLGQDGAAASDGSEESIDPLESGATAASDGSAESIDPSASGAAESSSSAAETTKAKDDTYPKTLVCTDSNCMISVTYGEDAKLPDGVELRAQEYSRDSETYLARFKEAAELYEWTEEDMRYFRLFNIGLYLDEEEVQPEAEVDVTITYMGPEPGSGCQVVHFTEKPEAVEADASFSEGKQVVDFPADGFSDYGVMAAGARIMGYHPQGAVTETWKVSGVNLYSLDTAQDDAPPLPGVTYTVYQNGWEVASFTTGTEYALSLGDLAPGTYTIKQTGVPDGYKVVEQEKTFTVKSRSGWTSAGVFFVYPANDESGFPRKTAQVSEYVKRIYQVTLSALSQSYNPQINPGNFNFVVDRSNSMLFPAVLTDTGLKVTLYREANDKTNYWSDSRSNSERLDALGLDPSKLYYIVAQKDTKATVYALWKSTANTNGRWYYQDAAAYAKAAGGTGDFSDVNGDGAWINNGTWIDGIDERWKRNDTTGQWDWQGIKFHLGGDLGADIPVGGSKEYPIYTGNEFNRLTYLKYNMSLLIHELAAFNPQSTVTLTTFDNEVQRCIKRTLNTLGVADLIAAVENIQTGGGTAQEKGLRHVTGDYPHTGGNVTCNGGSHLSTDKENYVVLITDGALNSKDNGTNAEPLLREAATKIRNQGATLITVGLSLQDVTSAKKLLTDVSKGGIASDGYAFLDENADQLAEVMQNAILGNLISAGAASGQATVTDYISDSFYLVSSDGKTVLNEGDWIDLNGTKITYSGWIVQRPSGPEEGKVRRDANGNWYIEWANKTLPTDRTNPWTANFYVKAKEDFIGGNAIDTNKSATVNMLDDRGNTAMTIPLESPTVNVRLLPMNQSDSEETVFLGDTVVPRERLESLLEKIRFDKILKPSSGDVYNKPGKTSADGVGSNDFTLAYAMGQLTEDNWSNLLAGNAVCVEYTYDDASSHGPVGYFTVKLEKTGKPDSYNEHGTAETGREVETYTLSVIYTAYRLDEAGRPSATVHNSYGNGPGYEVGDPDRGWVTRLEDGYGTVPSNNVHKVHVVDGKITVIKEIDPGLKSAADQSFTFTLEKRNMDGSYTEVKDAAGNPVTLQTVVGANQTSGTNTLYGLPRGTYKLVEAAGDSYKARDMTVVDPTNCQSAGSGTLEVTFTIGTDTNGTDVIRSGTSPVYSTLRGSTPGTSPACVGVSYGTVRVFNEKTAFMTELPVQKKWNEIPESEYSGLTAYAALYQNGSPVTDENGHVLALALDQENGWKGSFTVALDQKDQSVADLGYEIRELDGVTEANTGNLSAAVVMNGPEGSEHTIIYYKKAADSGLVRVGDKGFLVSWKGTDVDGKYTLVATNSSAARLPETGGSGTRLYTLGGILVICLGFLLSYRNKKRGKEDFASS